MASSSRSTTLSTKGQVILPKAIRDRLKWSAGTRLTVEETTAGVVLRAATAFAPADRGAAFGMLAHSGKAKTLEEMDAAIAAELRRRHARDRY
ncbi:MAG: AbrB/MazE/SpoVT family DNA-binding domain-containing protein [Hyphomonadaceae bacterium]